MNPRITAVVVALVVAVLAVSSSLPWLKTPVLLALANGLAVCGVIVLIRAGQVSFGHAMYACFAGYAVAFIARAWHLDALLLIALATLLATAAGAVIGLFIVRYRGIFFGMLNLAFSMVLFSVLGKFGGVTGGGERNGGNTSGNGKAGHRESPLVVGWPFDRLRANGWQVNGTTPRSSAHTSSRRACASASSSASAPRPRR